LPCCREESDHHGADPAAQNPQPAPSGGFRSGRSCSTSTVRLVVVVITWAEWDYLRGLGFTLTDHGEGQLKDRSAGRRSLTTPYSGSLLLVFFASLCGQFLQPKSRRVADILLTGWAIGRMLATFPEDGPPFGEPITWVGYLHRIGFVCIVVFGMTGMVATDVAPAATWLGAATRPSP
jgi:hypothetical protein